MEAKFFKRLKTFYLISFAFFFSPGAYGQTTPFLWGSGHSAFQSEGNPQNSDWKTWTHTAGKIKDASNADHATDFWNDYEADFDLAKDLSSNVFRLSIAWERIETKPGIYNPEALNHYVKIIGALRKRGLEPIVTLQHFVLPEWLAQQGGILAPNFVERFSKYFMHVTERLAAAPLHVKYFMTINEPLVLVNAGFLEGIWPPGLKDPKLANEAVAQLARAHVKSYQLARANPALNDIQISIAKHWRIFEGKGILGSIIAKMSDWAFNRQIMKALTTGNAYFWIPGATGIKEKFQIPEGRSGFLDFIGINYYGRLFTSFTPQAPFVKVEEGPGEKTDIGWEIYPQGLYETLIDIKRYNLPILISENGLADASDSKRTKFISDHFSQMHRAMIDQGVPVFGYLHWSLTDNYEWAFGLSPRFGLVAYDYNKKSRSKRPSFDAYKKLIEEYRQKGLK
jgi:beta-glucosidase